MVPEATQNRSSSHVEPTAVLIEVIENGANIQPDWSKVISNTDKSISEQAIDRLSRFANNLTFRSGKIEQFIMLGSEYTDNANKFNNAEVIDNFDKLNTILSEKVLHLL